MTTSDRDPLSKMVTAHKGLEIAHRQGDDEGRACAAVHEELKMSVEPKKLRGFKFNWKKGDGSRHTW